MIKETKQVEEIISGPTKIVDPDASEYEDCITYEKPKNGKKNKNTKEKK